MTSQLIAKNLTYVLTGITTLIFIAFLSSLYFGVDMHALFVHNTPNEVKKIVVDDAVNYISPSITMKNKKKSLGLAEEVNENGQITAIHTGQVTYKQSRYIVKPGDTLRIIAEQVYGDPEAWMPIMKANNLVSPDLIEIGMELVIPR